MSPGRKWLKWTRQVLAGAQGVWIVFGCEGTPIGDDFDQQLAAVNDNG